MIDARILPLQRSVLQPIAEFLARRGVKADTLSLSGFALGVGAFAALAFGYWFAALALILGNRLLDGLDGAVARIHGPTDRGAFLDIALDMVFYALIPLGFAVQSPEFNALPAAVLIVSFVGTGSSFLAFSAVASRMGRKAPEFPTKGIYYAGGLAEGFETIVVFIAICLLPAAFPAIAYAFALMCGITTVIRWRQAWVVFSGDRSE
ncbi:CDP-alcohol phosphatidyltransferase family protein [Ciceribacter sp. L1K22]|uniref:CDP-alcohol phosphatidyltransferase family protein n=1 Tax=Ciceribacter sp. L1K22 TaxID=2820275 RepID=UPI001ABE6B71|nr:CDP-alcohol phosphatidyltransferase family protein [Ciceribacter sp. L1K22]MBO3758965.1 CDP-alcohol phosphatidyltransferase family protein [Ciceribacter sp. L1K22]